MTLNLLPIAMNATSILGCNQQFEFYQFQGSTLDDLGRDIPQYSDPMNLKGSIQAVPNKMYEQLGLDLDKNYITVFCPQLIQSLATNTQPDRIIWNNRTFEAIETKDWTNLNGYTKTLFVEIKDERNN